MHCSAARVLQLRVAGTIASEASETASAMIVAWQLGRMSSHNLLKALTVTQLQTCPLSSVNMTSCTKGSPPPQPTPICHHESPEL